MTISEKVFIILRDICGLDDISYIEFINDYQDYRLREDLLLDEHRAMEMYFKLKDYFPGFIMSKEEAEKLKTVKDAMNFVIKRVGEKL